MGNISNITLDNLQKGQKCILCRNNTMSALYRKDFKEVKIAFEKEGYEILSCDYRNNQSPIICICPEGHEWETDWARFGSGTRCLHCFGNPKLTLEELKDKAKLFGEFKIVNVVSDKYVLKVNVQCPNHHDSWIDWGVFIIVNIIVDNVIWISIKVKTTRTIDMT